MKDVSAAAHRDLLSWSLRTWEARPSFLPLTAGEPEAQPGTPVICFLTIVFSEIFSFLPSCLLLSIYLSTVDPFVMWHLVCYVIFSISLKNLLQNG